MNREAVIGQRIAALREAAGLKQNELAKRIEWSPAVLSRVETGERSISGDELQSILAGIATPEASKLQELLERYWRVLPEPDLTDPDTDLLWQAEQAAQAIHDLAESPDVKQFFERRLVRYESELSTAAANVANKRYRAAFVGTIAVGKSTAICRAEQLELPTTKGMPKAVMETGAGGITVCEVHVRKGPGHGLIIEPCSDEEIRRHVADFANFLLNPAATSNEDDGTAGSPGISREIERSLRSMSGLSRRRSEKKSDGTVIPAMDKARDLARGFPDSKALSVEILARMELHKRDRRDIWHASNIGKPPLEWLQETFERVNNGRHDEFTLPRRIELVIPQALLGEESLAVTLIDTQGIDDIAGRADLEQHFDDPHTAVVLCTRFDEAPSISVRQLLTRAREGGVRTLDTHAALLVLPRPDEPLAVKDNGYPVQSASEGCDIKAEEVQLRLHSLGLLQMPVSFFNAATDVPEDLRTFLLARINAVQEFHRNRLREIIGGANALLLNYGEEQSREIMAAAARRLTTWIEHHAELPAANGNHVQDSLLGALRAAHASTIRASVVRDGDWQNLNYGHQLSHGARRIAALSAEPKLTGFREIANNLLDDDQFAEAHDLVRQTVRLLEDGFDSIVRRAQLVGRSVHADEMRADGEFWQACGQEWGRGSGYRDRIDRRNRGWFETVNQGQADRRVLDLVSEQWRDAVTAVRELLGGHATTQ